MTAKLIALLTSSLVFAPAIASDFRPVESWGVEAIRAFLDDALLDAESARFRDVVFVDGRTVCGKVNSKNAMGAYVGNRTFVAYVDGTASAPVALVLGMDDGESTAASSLCASHGY